jgi:hypothetical protein
LAIFLVGNGIISFYQATNVSLLAYYVKPMLHPSSKYLKPISHGVKEDLPSQEGWGHVTTGLTKYFPTDFLLFLAKGIIYSFNTLYLRAF